MPDDSTISFLKIEEDLRLVLGWASVNMVNGEHVVDLHNDVIESRELVKAAMEFMSYSRTGGIMHFKNEYGEPAKIGEVVFALPFTKDIKKAFGVDIPEEGLAIGVRIDDEKVWEMVKNGSLSAFSIGGHADRLGIAE